MNKGFPLRFLENNSELVNYTEENLPVRSVISCQEEYPTLSCVNHWHNDFEFSYVSRGHMMYSVNGENIELNEGDMIFVNSARLHYGYWEKREECEFLCVLFGIELLCTVPQKIIVQLTDSEAMPYIVFRRACPSDNMLIEKIEKLNNLCEQKKEGYELSVVTLCYEITQQLYCCCTEQSYISTDQRGLSELHAIIGYIQGHYTEKLSMEDISAAGRICRSKCFELFKEYIGKTPFEYLNEYRISKSIDMLKNTDMNITEIALHCGFGNSSYFAEVFRKYIGCSPKQFQKKEFYDRRII